MSLPFVWPDIGASGALEIRSTDNVQEFTQSPRLLGWVPSAGCNRLNAINWMPLVRGCIVTTNTVWGDSLKRRWLRVAITMITPWMCCPWCRVTGWWRVRVPTVRPNGTRSSAGTILKLAQLEAIGFRFQFGQMSRCHKVRPYGAPKFIRAFSKQLIGVLLSSRWSPCSQFYGYDPLWLTVRMKPVESTRLTVCSGWVCESLQITRTNSLETSNRSVSYHSVTLELLGQFLVSYSTDPFEET